MSHRAKPDLSHRAKPDVKPSRTCCCIHPIKTKHRKSKHHHNQWILCQDAIFAQWVSLKSDDSKTAATEALVDKKKTADELYKQIVEMFKKIVKEVLNEFKNPNK